VTGVVLLSLLPGPLMPSIGRGIVEHFAAYAVLAAAAALGYGRSLGYLPLLAAATVLAAAFEGVQLFLPERTFSTLDFLAGVAGATLGVSLAHLIRRTAGRPKDAQVQPDRS
jgi:VanZ family protein